MNTLYAATLTFEILDLQLTIKQVTGDYAAGVLLGDLRKLLNEYAIADFVIFRCGCEVFELPIKSAPHVKQYCDTCGKDHERLLADGTWQAEEQRQIENSKQYQRGEK